MKPNLAIAYSMKRKAKKMAQGGMMTGGGYQSSCSAGCNSPCEVHAQAEMSMEHESAAPAGNEAAMQEDDMVGRIMARRMSRGGMVANGGQDELPDMADSSPNEFDDLALRDDLESSYTGENSGDELGNAQEDDDRADIVSRIMRSRAKKDRLPNPR